MNEPSWKLGDWVVYVKQKQSRSPGPRAKNVSPASAGDDYRYTVEKHWVVQQVHADGTVTLRTRRGKQHVVSADDPMLRRPRLWQRLIFASRFKAVAAAIQSPPQPSP